MPHRISRNASTHADSLPVPNSLRVLQGDIASCTVCRSMRPWRKFEREVYGTASTGYLLIGEAPGYLSWKKGRRFTGPAGMLIRRALQRVGHPRYRDLEDLFYMTDVVKCHPAPADNPASNRSPSRAEIQACSGHLMRELRLLDPSVVVTFGKAAAEAVQRAAPAIQHIAFPHPSPRNQRTILKHYPSMRAFEEAIVATCRELIARLEKGRKDNTVSGRSN